MGGMKSIYPRLLVFITVIALNLMASLYLILHHDRAKEKHFQGPGVPKVRCVDGLMVIKWSKS